MPLTLTLTLISCLDNMFPDTLPLVFSIFIKKFMKLWENVKIKYFIDNGLNFMIFRLFLIGSPLFSHFCVQKFLCREINKKCRFRGENSKMKNSFAPWKCAFLTTRTWVFDL